jgi:regulator of sigma E protease
VSFGVAILGLAALILIHAAGHFFVARAVGMTPRKFYLGFGPAIVKTVRNGVEYGIAAFPLGGYVKIPGMHRPAPGDLRKSLPPAEQEELREPLAALDAALERGDDQAALSRLRALEPKLGKNRLYEELEGALALDAYWRQPARKQIAVIAAGPLTNVVVALALFVALFMLGSVKPTRTVDSVLKSHPAAAAGLRPGDRIIAIAGHPVQPDGISKAINGTEGRPFTIVVSRHGQRVTVGPLRARNDGGVYRVGFAIRGAPGPGEAFPSAVWHSLKLVERVTVETARSLWALVSGQNTHNVSSAVGIVRATSQAYKQSFQDFVGVLGLISLALAILNLLPLLPLDGGHIVMSILERLRGRAFSQLAYMRYSAVGLTLFAFLLYFGFRNDHVLPGG